jgi:hypothetical protein
MKILVEVGVVYGASQTSYFCGTCGVSLHSALGRRLQLIHPAATADRECQYAGKTFWKPMVEVEVKEVL